MTKAHHRTIKILALVIAVAALFSMLPFSTVINFVRASDAPYYNPEMYSFDAPTQNSQSFTSKKFNVQNPAFGSSDVSVFSSGSATGWTASTSTSAVTGVLNTNSFDTFKSNNSLNFTNKDPNYNFMLTNPLSSTSDNSNVLVMANKSISGTASANYSQNIGEFWADGYFEVTVDFYAVKSQSAIYLTPDEDFTDNRSIPRVDVNQVSITDNSNNLLPAVSIWQTATFLVKTDSLQSVNFTLGLYLGKTGGKATSGVVYYDSVHVTAYNKELFQTKWDTAKQNQDNHTGKYYLTSLVDLTAPEDPTLPIDKVNAIDSVSSQPLYENFDTQDSVNFKAINGSDTTAIQVKPFVGLNDISAKLNIKEETTVYGNASVGNTGVMLLTAVDSKCGVQYSNPVTFNRHEVYMISFYALASNNSSYIRIRDTRYGTVDLEDYITPYNSGYKSIKLNSTSSAAAHNNWILNTVFVTGETLADTSAYIEFWVGYSGSETTGYLLIDDFKIEKVSNKFYEKYMSTSNATICDSMDKTTEDSTTVSNPYFNKGTTRSADLPYPLVASNWTVALEGETVTDHINETKILNGIINTDDTHWSTNNKLTTSGKAYGMAVNPREISYNSQSLNNNIYMIQNNQATYQSVTSNSFSLGADSKNLISFDAATYNLSTREVWAVIEIGGREVTRLRLCSETGSVTTLSNWKNYVIAIETSAFSTPQVSLTFLLGDTGTEKQTTGCLFIDNIRVNQNTSGNYDYVSLKDPSKLYLNNNSDDQGGTSLFFTANKHDDVNYTASAYYDKNNDILSISTNGTRHAIITNTMTEQLNADTCYEYSVFVTTANVSVNNDYYKSLDEAYDWGISLKIDGMDGGFEHMQNADFKDMQRNTRVTTSGKRIDCIEFKFYIKSSSTIDLALVIEFGNKNVMVEGAIGIIGTSLIEISDSDFDAATENNTTSIITTATKTSEDDDSGSSSGIKLNFLIIPSLITAIAILIAVGGSIVRRSKFNFHIKKHHTSYARDDMETKTSKKDRKTPIAAKSSKPKRELNMPENDTTNN